MTSSDYNFPSNHPRPIDNPKQPSGQKPVDDTVKSKPVKTEQKNTESVMEQKLPILKDINDPHKPMDDIEFTATQTVQGPKNEKIEQLKTKILKNEPKKPQGLDLRKQLLRANIPINRSKDKLVTPLTAKEVIETVTKEVEKLALTKEEQISISKHLSDTYSENLPKPQTNYGDNTVLVWRGLNAKQLVMMAASKSAGGKAVDSNATPPTENELVAQVGEYGRLPEFTYDETIAQAFGTNNYVAAFIINKSYLGKGSVTEGGVICRDEAPVKIVAWTKGRVIS